MTKHDPQVVWRIYEGLPPHEKVAMRLKALIGDAIARTGTTRVPGSALAGLLQCLDPIGVRIDDKNHACGPAIASKQCQFIVDFATKPVSTPDGIGAQIAPCDRKAAE
jgi:hypothetical protein